MPAADDDELLSAYLDGELTAEERARVEQWLAERPESRQLLEELRAMKTSLERMPRARLGHDFADRVLRQAEKELLTGGDDDARQLGPTTTIELAGRVERRDGFSWQRVRRPVLWASLTLAAGLLIMFLEGKRPAPVPHRQVAQAPGMAGERGHGEIGAPAGASGPATAPAVPQVEVEVESKLGRKSRPEGSAARSETKAGTQRAAEEPPSAAPEAKKPSVEQRASGSARRFDSAHPENAKRDSTVAGGGQTTDLNDAMKREHEAGGEELQAIANNPTLVVWCDVAPSADYNETFRELLAKENIHWEEAAVSEAENLNMGRVENRPERAKLPVDAPADKVSQKGELPDDGAQVREVDAKNLALFLSRRGDRTEAMHLADAEEAVLDPHTEMVLVAASQPQIEAVLAALDRDDDVFMSVDVEPAADAPQQRPLERYRRGLSEKLEKRSEKPAAKQQPQADEKTSPKPAPLATTKDDETDENRSRAGVARKLKPNTSALAEAVGKKAESGKATEAGQSGLEAAPQRESKLRLSQHSRAPAAPDGQFGLKTEQDQLQVLFVLRPREAQEASKAAAPAKEKND